jgi:hypothetical protein
MLLLFNEFLIIRMYNIFLLIFCMHFNLKKEKTIDSTVINNDCRKMKLDCVATH